MKLSSKTREKYADRGTLRQIMQLKQKNRVNVEYHATTESCFDKCRVDIPNVV
jgi:hypothetical protein